MSINQELERICNTAGYPMYPWAFTQLSKRSKLGSLKDRDDNNLTYLANKGAWIRVVSSVNIEGGSFNYFKNIAQGLQNERSLAENFILYGGTSTYAYKSQQLLRETPNDQGVVETYEVGDLQGSRTQGMNLRSGLDAYNLTGDQEIRDFGYRPMPGITSVTIDSTGRMGSLRQATINFKVWDKYQLDIMDALYFRPGFTVLLEWGHAKYYDNNENLQSSEEFMINPFQRDLTKESIQIQINTNTQKAAGNYGGMLGIVTNFNFSITEDGGYDCSIIVTALGSVLGSFPINHAAVLPDTYYEQLTQLLNRGRNQEISLAKATAADIEAKKIQEFNESLDEKSRALLRIANDKYGTLLYNSGILESDIQSFIEKSKNDTIRQQRNLEEPLNFAEDLIKQEKSKSIILFSSTDGNTAAYYNESEFYNNILYLDNSNNPNIHEKYITSYEKDSDKIIVKLNRDGLSEAANSTDSNKIKFFSGQENSKYYYNLVVGLDGQSRYNLIVFKYPEQRTIQNGVNTIISAEQAFNTIKNDTFLNINAQYKIVAIKSNVFLKTDNAKSQQAVYIKLQYRFDPRYSIELGLDISDSGNQVSFFEDIGKTSYTALADLSLITSIEGNQDLTINKIDVKRQQAISEAEKAKKDYLDSQSKVVDAKYTTEQLKTTIQGESTIELMLRSLLVYAINSPNQNNKEKFKKYIAALFSEGAYKNFFQNGIPQKKEYTLNDLKAYVNGSMTPEKRLEMNMMYGNNFSLMSCEDVLDENGNVKENYIKTLPQVDFNKLFEIVLVQYGKTADIEIINKPDACVYINLGLFFLMLNHTGILYNKQTLNSLSKNEVITPMAYLDFNPETNYYLSSENQFSINPYKFLVRFPSSAKTYKKLFDKELIPNGIITYKAKEYIKDKDTPVEITKTESLFDPKDDKLSRYLSDTKTGLEKQPNGYIGKLMNVQVEINHLLSIMSKYRTSSDSHEVYFQNVIEDIIFDLNKNMGNYNAYRLSYNDAANCYVITDDQLQSKPHSSLSSIKSEMIDKPENFEIPIYGVKSIARTINITTDISSRLASYLVIASNPGVDTQVMTSKNTTDFGVYNTGSYDRYTMIKTDGTATPENNNVQNAQAAELAVNFNSVVSKIYTIKKSVPLPDESQDDTTIRQNISDSDIDRALGYYIDRMAKVKNAQKDTAHAMIIPLNVNITMDGMSGIYPFQLFTINENILPYRYSSAALNKRKVAFTITKITNNFELNQWTTTLQGKMVLLKNDSKEEDQKLIEIAETARPQSGVTAISTDYSNIKFNDQTKLDVQNINQNLLLNINKAAMDVGAIVTITTAITGHKPQTESNNVSRHITGNAVDISIINDQSVSLLSTQEDTIADKFVKALENMGYSREEKSKITDSSAVLYKIPNHTNHIHVSKI